MKTRVTQTDIGRVAGVHNTTVSLALRNSPAIPEPTRTRIQAIAKQMGYQPDPALQALVAYRNGLAPSRCQETIAYVTNWNSRWGWQEMPAHAKYYAGARRKAAQAGFQLDHFWLGEPGMTQRRLSSMLFHRGISGVILAAHRADADACDEMDWARLTAVKLGCFPHTPALHRVTDDQSGAMRLVLERTFAAGYDRIGLVMPYWWDNFVDQAWSAGFLARQGRLPEGCRIPILWHGSQDHRSPCNGRPVDLTVFANWFERYQPEAIVSCAPFVRGQIDQLGLGVPRDVAYVDLFLDGTGRSVAGVRENCEHVGEIATELLIGQMRQNRCGLPAVATTTLVEGRWVDGESLPPLRPRDQWLDERPAPNGSDDPALVLVP